MKLCFDARIILTLGLCLCLNHAKAFDRGLLSGGHVPAPNARVYTQTQAGITVTTSVPSRKETKDLFGVDLYKRNVQPVWVQVKNETGEKVILTPLGLDPAYYSARETVHVTWGQAFGDRNQNFEQVAIRDLPIAAKSTISGYIFSQVDEGTKAFNIDVFTACIKTSST